MLRLRRYERISIENWLQQGQFCPKFQVEGVAATNRSSCQKTKMYDLSRSIRMWAQVSFVLSQSTRLTDGQTHTDGWTDISLMAKTDLHSTRRGKNWLVQHCLQLGILWILHEHHVKHQNICKFLIRRNGTGLFVKFTAHHRSFSTKVGKLVILCEIKTMSTNHGFDRFLTADVP